MCSCKQIAVSQIVVAICVCICVCINVCTCVFTCDIGCELNIMNAPTSVYLMWSAQYWCCSRRWLLAVYWRDRSDSSCVYTNITLFLYNYALYLKLKLNFFETVFVQVILQCSYIYLLLFVSFFQNKSVLKVALFIYLLLWKYEV